MANIWIRNEDWLEENVLSALYSALSPKYVYCDSVGGDDNNDGVTAPVRTLKKAFEVSQQFLYPGNMVIISLEGTADSPQTYTFQEDLRLKLYSAYLKIRNRYDDVDGSIIKGTGTAGNVLQFVGGEVNFEYLTFKGSDFVEDQDTKFSCLIYFTNTKVYGGHLKMLWEDYNYGRGYEYNCMMIAYNTSLYLGNCTIDGLASDGTSKIGRGVGLLSGYILLDNCTFTNNNVCVYGYPYRPVAGAVAQYNCNFDESNEHVFQNLRGVVHNLPGNPFGL